MGALAGAFAGVAVVSLVILTTRWSFFYFGVIGTIFTFGIGYAVSLLFPKPRPEQIHGLVMGQGEVRDENTSAPRTSA